MWPASAAGMSTRLDRWAPTATNTASKRPRGARARGPRPNSCGQPHPERGDPIDLCADHVAWQPVGGNPVAHHPARLGAGVANLDLVSEPARDGRRPTDRSAPRRSPARACRSAPAVDRTPRPARAPGRRGTARPRESTARCRDRRDCRRSHTGGSRPGRGSPGTGSRRSAARQACSCSPALTCAIQPWMFSPPGSPRCRVGADRRTPVARRARAPCASAPAPGRAGA